MKKDKKEKNNILLISFLILVFLLILFKSFNLKILKSNNTNTNTNTTTSSSVEIDDENLIFNTRIEISEEEYLEYSSSKLIHYDFSDVEKYLYDNLKIDKLYDFKVVNNEYYSLCKKDNKILFLKLDNKKNILIKKEYNKSLNPKMILTDKNIFIINNSKSIDEYLKKSNQFENNIYVYDINGQEIKELKNSNFFTTITSSSKGYIGTYIKNNKTYLIQYDFNFNKILEKEILLYDDNDEIIKEESIKYINKIKETPNGYVYLLGKKVDKYLLDSTSFSNCDSKGLISIYDMDGNFFSNQETSYNNKNNIFDIEILDNGDYLLIGSNVYDKIKNKIICIIYDQKNYFKKTEMFNGVFSYLNKDENNNYTIVSNFYEKVFETPHSAATYEISVDEYNLE